MKLEGMKILVIGGAGFIGSHVAEALLKENVEEVVIFDNFCRGTKENIKNVLKDPRCKVFEDGGDILYRDILLRAMEGKNAVIHLAALWLLHCQEYFDSAFEVNIRGTFNVLQACVERGIKKVIYSSSASVYGDAVEEPMTEDHPYNNWTFYGATKIAGEHMIRAFNGRYDLDGVCLRYMNVYGPRQDYRGTYIAVIMKMLDSIREGRDIVINGDGSQSYDFIYVEDVARANVCALKSETRFGFYNVGTGIKTSIKELADLLLEIAPYAAAPIKYEPAVISFVTNRVGSIVLAEKDLGFECETGLREGLKKLMEWKWNEEEVGGELCISLARE